MGPTAKIFLHHHLRRKLSTLRNPNPGFLSNHQHLPVQNPNFLSPFSSRSFSWSPWARSSVPSHDSGSELASPSEPEFASPNRSEFGTLEEDGGSDVADVAFGSGSDLGAVNGSEMGLAEEAWYSPAVNAVISGLDGFHDLSGLPWWVVISASTLCLRATLFPVLILQLKKGEEIAKLLPKLPPPLPPPLSGRSYREQYMLFQSKRRELGCPSYLWSFAYFFVQFPCFLLWMTSIRQMCLSHHVGFDNGGTLWFSDLTDIPGGILGSTFPILISCLHYTNVQISFRTFKLQTLPGIYGILIKYYKMYLDILAIPLLLIGFNVPQGSLVYWATNSSLTLIQNLSLKNPIVRQKLGLSAEKILEEKKKTLQISFTPEGSDSVQQEMPAEALPADTLFDVAVEALAAGHHEKAQPLLQLAIEKDPESVRALIAMGQILFSKMSFEEAAEHFEKAILKVEHVGKVDDEDGFLVLALFSAGLSRVQQGRISEGIQHLKRIHELKVPEKLMSKECYYKGLAVLGSTLFVEGEKSEALKYLKIAAAYNPDYNAYVKECEEG